MTRFFNIAFLTLICLVLTPTETYAYGLKSDKKENTCPEQSDTEKEKKDCYDSAKGQCKKYLKDCDANCGNPVCNCPSNSTSSTIPFIAQLTQLIVIASKQNFYYQETYYSSGFLSILLPPKIAKSCIESHRYVLLKAKLWLSELIILKNLKVKKMKRSSRIPFLKIFIL